MSTCPKCGREHTVEGSRCADRSRRLRVRNQAESASPDIESIAFVLGEIPEWRAQGWICEHCSDLLLAEYRSREASLLASPSNLMTAETSATLAVPDSAEVGKQNLPESRGTALAELMESHSMKLLALLAALFILVGMRQILVWKWAGAFALALIPLLPVSLTGVFYYFGVKSQYERSIGGYVYCLVAIFLSVFTVFAINEYWLGGRLAQPSSLTLSMCTATILTAWTLKQTRDSAFLHVLLGGIVATAYTTIRTAFHSPWLAPEPAWAYGSGLIGLAMLYLLAARKLTTTPSAGERERTISQLLVLWMHFCATAALAVGLVPYASNHGNNIELGVLMAFAAVLYALFAWSFAGAAAVYISAAIGLTSALLLLAGAHRLEWYPAGLAAAGLSISWLALSTRKEQPNVAAVTSRCLIAVEKTAWALSSLAGACLLARLCLSVAGMAASPASVDWVVGAILGASCAGIYAFVGSRANRPAILYGAIFSAGFALTVSTSRLLAISHVLPSKTPANDILPFVAASVAIGLWTSRANAEVAVSKLAAASGPLHWSGLVSASLALAVTLILALQDGPTPGFWIAVVSYGIVAAGAVAAQRIEWDRILEAGWAFCLVFAVAIFTSFQAAIHSPGAPWTPLLASGAALTMLAWGWFVLAL